MARAADAILDQAVVAAVPVQAPTRFRGLLGEAAGVRLDQVSLDRDTARRLDAVSLEVAPGELVAVLGPAASGKTSLLRVMAGLERPSAGRVWAAGAALEALTGRELDAYRLQRVGLLGAAPSLLETMTGVENAGLPLLLAGVGPAEGYARARKLLELLGAGRAAEQRAARLSASDRRLVAVARALAGSPGLLLADEPLAGLDEEDGRRLLALLRELNRSGLTVVIFTSDPELALEAARTIRLRAGRALPSPEAPRAAHAPGKLEPPGRPSAGDLARLAVHSPVGWAQAGSLVACAATGAALAMLLGLAQAGPAARPLERALLVMAAVLAGAGLAALAALSVAAVERRRRLLGMLRGIGAGAEVIGRILILEAVGLGALAGVAACLLASAVAGFAQAPRPGALTDAVALGASVLLMVAAAVPAAYAARLPGFLRDGC